MELTRVHNFDMVESGHTQPNFRNATSICILFEKKTTTKNCKLSQPRKQTPGERELPRPRQLSAMHINILQPNVHGLQETHIEQTHKMLALSELQQIVIPLSSRKREMQNSYQNDAHTAK